MNPYRILYLKLIFLPYIRLSMLLLSVKYFFILDLYIPIRRFKNTLKFILKLRIKCGIPLRMGWKAAQDTIRTMDREEP